MDVQTQPAGTRLILFDVGATLVDPHPSARELVINVLRQHGLAVGVDDMIRAEPLAFKQVAHLTPFERYGLEEARAFWDRFYSALLTTLGLPNQPTVRASLFDAFQQLENWRLYDDVVPVLQDLRAQGLRLGVVSNWEEWLEDLLLDLDVHGLFDFILASGPFGRAKPHASIFERALALAGVSAEATVHVGDSPREDIQGARGAGLEAILIDRHGRHLNAEGVRRITTLTDLPELLTS